MTKFKIYITSCTNPYINLAVEDWLFRNCEDTHIMFLWRNTPSVVMGRFQNPWQECHIENIISDNVNLVRRQSGGGCVYHDLDNLNFTFISPKELYNKDNNNSIIIDALKNLGIDAYASGRNDLLVNLDDCPRKISGSAFKQIKNLSFHHGTLLINSDLTRLNGYLRPKKKKVESRSIKSVRSDVENLTTFNCDISYDSIVSSLVSSFNSIHGADCIPLGLCEKSSLESTHVESYYKTLSNWDWIYGETPKFTQSLNIRVTGQSIPIFLFSHKGLVKKVQIDMMNDLADYCNSHLVDQKYTESTFKNIKKAFLKTDKFDAQLLSNLINVLIEECK